MKNSITEREKDITRRILEGDSHKEAGRVYRISVERTRQLFTRTIERLGCEKAPIDEHRANSVMLIHQLYNGSGNRFCGVHI